MLTLVQAPAHPRRAETRAQRQVSGATAELLPAPVEAAPDDVTARSSMAVNHVLEQLHRLRCTLGAGTYASVVQLDSVHSDTLGYLVDNNVISCKEDDFGEMTYAIVDAVGGCTIQEADTKRETEAAVQGQAAPANMLPRPPRPADPRLQCPTCLRWFSWLLRCADCGGCIPALECPVVEGGLL